MNQILVDKAKEFLRKKKGKHILRVSKNTAHKTKYFIELGEKRAMEHNDYFDLELVELEIEQLDNEDTYYALREQRQEILENSDRTDETIWSRGRK